MNDAIWPGAPRDLDLLGIWSLGAIILLIRSTQ
jgi:hypothetical protein